MDLIFINNLDGNSNILQTQSNKPLTGVIEDSKILQVVNYISKYVYDQNVPTIYTSNTKKAIGSYQKINNISNKHFSKNISKSLDFNLSEVFIPSVDGKELKYNFDSIQFNKLELSDYFETAYQVKERFKTICENFKSYKVYVGITHKLFMKSVLQYVITDFIDIDEFYNLQITQYSIIHLKVDKDNVVLYSLVNF